MEKSSREKENKKRKSEKTSSYRERGLSDPRLDILASMHWQKKRNGTRGTQAKRAKEAETGTNTQRDNSRDGPSKLKEEERMRQSRTEGPQRRLEG